MGRKKITFTKDMDNKLLNLISKGKTLLQLTIAMKMCGPIIESRIKEMGFEGLNDARRVMNK